MKKLATNRLTKKERTKLVRRKQGSPSGVDKSALRDSGANLVINRATTHKGRKLLAAREPQLHEGTKKSLFLKANQASSVVQQLLRDLHLIRKPESLLLSRRHSNVQIFQDASTVEYLCRKSDCALFCIGSSTKKRPFNILFGRTFNAELLDVYEFAVSSYVPLSHFNTTKMPTLGSKPLVICQGAFFEGTELIERIKNIFCDIFSCGSAKKFCLKGVEHVIVLTVVEDDAHDVNAVLRHTTGAVGGGFLGGLNSTARQSLQGDSDDVEMNPNILGETLNGTNQVKGVNIPQRGNNLRILFRHYMIELKKSAEGALFPRVELREIGPSFTLQLDRNRMADAERWKAALRVPKPDMPKKKKNISRSALGEAVGRVHVGKQLTDKIYTPHFHLKGKSQRRERKAPREEAQRPQAEPIQNPSPI